MINITDYFYICYVPINFNYFNLINSVFVKNKLNHCYIIVIILYISNSSYKFLSKNAVLNFVNENPNLLQYDFNNIIVAYYINS